MQETQITSSAVAFKKELENAAQAAKDWFDKTSCPAKGRKEFETKLGDNGSGAVYAYYGKDGKALYVGQTGRKIKARQHDQTSPHKKKVWWKNWETMRFVQMSDETDRLILEFHLIMGLQPSENRKPKAKTIDELFKENART